MSYTKTIVCLANSRKPPSGRCVAGREITAAGFGDWIRPISARPGHEISEEERRYEHGKDPKVTDLIVIRLKCPQPDRHQQENYVIDADYYWAKQGTMSWDALQPAVESLDGPLWLNGYSSKHGENDRVPETEVNRFSRSLYLLRPDRLVLVVAAEGGEFGPPRRRVRACFDLSAQAYCMVVTDPPMERALLAKGDGETRLEDALLCVSLSELFHGYAYKLAAAVITPKRAGR